MSRRVALLVMTSIAFLPGAAGARRHALVPSTGLATIRFAQQPPDFAFDDGGSARRLRDLIGRPVVINFWASWCEPCRSEIGAFAELERTFGVGVALVTISEDRLPGAAAAYLRSHGVDGAVAVDDPERNIFELYSVVPIPTTLVLAPDGSVTHVSIGALDWAELRAAVDAVRPASLDPTSSF